MSTSLPGIGNLSVLPGAEINVWMVTKNGDVTCYNSNLNLVPSLGLGVFTIASSLGPVGASSGIQGAIAQGLMQVLTQEVIVSMTQLANQVYAGSYQATVGSTTIVVTVGVGTTGVMNFTVGRQVQFIKPVTKTYFITVPEVDTCDGQAVGIHQSANPFDTSSSTVSFTFNSEGSATCFYPHQPCTSSTLPGAASGGWYA